jgi:hypothetical protein
VKTYTYRDINRATPAPQGWVGEDVFVCQAKSLLEADEEFKASGLVFEVLVKGKMKLFPALSGVESLNFISCRWTESE